MPKLNLLDCFALKERTNCSPVSLLPMSLYAEIVENSRVERSQNSCKLSCDNDAMCFPELITTL